MINPNYKVQIDIALTKPIESETIWMRQVRYLPFVPMEGMKLRLTSEDGESNIDLTLDSVVYDAANGIFVVDITDDSMVSNYSESGKCGDKELVGQYLEFGFLRLNYPTAQAVRKENG